METNFSDLLKLLSGQRVDFIVVGGVACALNGIVRSTEDVDIIVNTNADNIDGYPLNNSRLNP